MTQEQMFDVIIKSEQGTVINARLRASELAGYFAKLDMLTIQEYTVRKL